MNYAINCARLKDNQWVLRLGTSLFLFVCDFEFSAKLRVGMRVGASETRLLGVELTFLCVVSSFGTSKQRQRLKHDNFGAINCLCKSSVSAQQGYHIKRRGSCCVRAARLLLCNSDTNVKHALNHAVAVAVIGVVLVVSILPWTSIRDNRIRTATIGVSAVRLSTSVALVHHCTSDSHWCPTIEVNTCFSAHRISHHREGSCACITRYSWGTRIIADSLVSRYLYAKMSLSLRGADSLIFSQAPPHVQHLAHRTAAISPRRGARPTRPVPCVISGARH